MGSSFPSFNANLLWIWRIDNKNAHLHRIYNEEKQILEMPEVNTSMKLYKFKRNFLDRGDYTEFETRQELDASLFLEMI